MDHINKGNSAILKSLGYDRPCGVYYTVDRDTPIITDYDQIVNELWGPAPYIDDVIDWLDQKYNLFISTRLCRWSETDFSTQLWANTIVHKGVALQIEAGYTNRNFAKAGGINMALKVLAIEHGNNI